MGSLILSIFFQWFKQYWNLNLNVIPICTSTHQQTNIVTDFHPFKSCHIPIGYNYYHPQNLGLWVNHFHYILELKDFFLIFSPFTTDELGRKLNWQDPTRAGVV